MNYIKKLQEENARLKAAAARAEQAINDVKAQLAGPKFTGTDADGSRKDWAATSDIHAWLTGIHDALMTDPVL